VIFEQSLRFNFPTSNNQVEYEACITGLLMAKDLRAKQVLLCGDFQLVISQVNREYQAKEPVLQKYLMKVKKLCFSFDKIEFKHVLRD